MSTENVKMTIPIRYKDIILAKQKAYYQKIKEKKQEYARNRYHNMTREQKDILLEKQKEKAKELTPEQKEKKKAYIREYNKNRYHNHVIYVES